MSAEVTKTLRLLFTCSEGRTRAVSLRDPIESPGETAIEDLMDHVVDNDLIKPQGVSLVSKVGAEMVERSVDTVYEPGE